MLSTFLLSPPFPFPSLPIFLFPPILPSSFFLPLYLFVFLLPFPPLPFSPPLLHPPLFLRAHSTIPRILLIFGTLYKIHYIICTCAYTPYLPEMSTPHTIPGLGGAQGKAPPPQKSQLPSPKTMNLSIHLQNSPQTKLKLKSIASLLLN